MTEDERNALVQRVQETAAKEVEMKEKQLLIGVPASEACSPAEAAIKIERQLEELRNVLRFVDRLVTQKLALDSTPEVQKIREIVEDRIAGLDAFGQFVRGKSQ